ncbi:MAG: AsmA family protein, partial [Caulobacteraceae bacterium]
MNSIPGFDWTRQRVLSPAGARAGRFGQWVQANDPVYTSFRHPGRMEKVVGGVALLIVAAIIVFLLLFDWNWLRGPIGRWASTKYHRQIELRGDLDVKLFSWNPSVVVNDLKFGGPQWALEKDTADIQRIEASVKLRKLLAGQIEMPLLSFTRPEVHLIATADGKRSWDLNPGAPDTGEGMKLPVIQQLIIQ